MPSPYFLLYELTLFLQFAVRLPHVWTRGKANLLRQFADKTSIVNRQMTKSSDGN